MKHNELAMQRALSERDITILNAELDRQKKSVAVSYLLWLFLGWLGVHQLYLGRMLRAALYPLLLLGGYVFSLSAVFAPATAEAEAVGGTFIIGAFMFAAYGLLILWDMITLPRQHAKRETRIKMRLLKTMTQTAS